MLAKKERLKRKDFNRFFSSGTRYHSNNFTLIFTKYAVFYGAVVISKKVERSAVKRNKIRRRIYSILRPISRAGRIRGVCICISKPSIKTRTFLELEREIEDVVSRIEK